MTSGRKDDAEVARAGDARVAALEAGMAERDARIAEREAKTAALAHRGPGPELEPDSRLCLRTVLDRGRPDAHRCLPPEPSQDAEAACKGGTVHLHLQQAVWQRFRGPW